MNIVQQDHTTGTLAQNGAPLSGIPAALRSLPHWVVRKAKVPHQARNPRYGASSTNPDHWSDLDSAIKTARRGDADGMGFVFALSLRMVFIDLDDCFDDHGNLKPYAAEIVAMFPTHWHISMSGKGLHGVCYGQIPAALKNSDAGVEMYSSDRYMAWPVDPVLWGDVQEVTDCSEAVSALYRRYAKPESTEQVSVPIAVSDDVEGVLERMAQTPKHAALLRGDASDYPGWSEARMGLAYAARFWNLGESDIADVLLRSNLFKPEDDERERRRRAANDAAKACKTYAGAFYNPSYGRNTTISITVPTADDPKIAALDRDELLAIIRKQTAVIDAERAARVAAEQRAARAENIRSTIHSILRNSDLNAGARLTAFAIAMDMNARTANGEAPADVEGFDKKARKSYSVQAFKAPAARYADVTGHSPQTVQRHMRELEGKGLLSKHLVRVETNVDDVDEETGEIVTVAGKRDVNYIALPDNDVINLVERFATYQRPEGDETGKHGGTRTPRPACVQHPEAGTFTVKHEHIECAECHAVLQASEPKRTYHAPDDHGESSPINLIPDNTTVVNVHSDTKLIAEESDDGDTSPIKMVCDRQCAHRMRTAQGWNECTNRASRGIYCDDHAAPVEGVAS